MTDVDMFKPLLKAEDRQIGGRHYKGYTIQPYDFISKNNLSLQGVYQNT